MVTELTPGVIHDIDLAPDVPRINARKFPELIDRYLTDVSRRNQTRTAAGYRARLSLFLDWWRVEGPARGYLLGADDLADYAAHLETVVSEKTGKPIRLGVFYYTPP